MARKEKAVDTTANEVTEMNLENTAVDTTATLEAPILPDKVRTPSYQPGTSGVEIILNECDYLNIDELKQVIEFCSNRIDELQREEVEALEAEMRAIQEKLMTMRGHKYQSKVSNKGDQGEYSGASKRNAIPLVNPDNPSEVYTFGKIPPFALKMMAETGKTIRELRQEAKEKQAKQAKQDAM